MATTQTTDAWERVILQAIHDRVGEMIEEEQAKAVERVSSRIRQEAAGICALVVSDIRFDRHGMDLVVRLQDHRS